MPFMSEAHLASLDDDRFDQLLATHSLLGFHPETQDGLLIPNLDRYAGMEVVGVQGVGKSGFLQNLIAQDILLDQAVIVIDPHGDLVDHCLAQLPDHKIPLTHVLDMTDEAYPFGLNVFGNHKAETAIGQAQAVDRVMHCFEVLWGDILTQQYLPRYLRAATLALFANPGSTLVDMHTFLVDEITRQRMLRAVTDPSVLRFWQSYDELSPSARRQQVEPLIGRLESLFMGRSLVRNIVGQRETSIDFRRAIEHKEIIFIKLPIKTLAQDAKLIGTFLIAQIHEAIFSFADMPEHQRPEFSLYVDEFQHFATSDFSEMFTEGRKFGVRTCFSHQYRGQLPSFLRESTMTARTKVCFQLTPEDAREMAHLYLHGEATVQPEDIEPHPVDYLLKYGSDNPFVQTLIEWYLQPLQRHKRGGAIEISRPGYRWDHLGFHLMGVKPPAGNPVVADPTAELNYLLYQVMKTGDALLPIPIEVVFGFANCGRGFYPAFRYSFDKGTLLSEDVHFPAFLVVVGGDGELRWTQPPETGKEQLYHFLFHLRMTMFHLAHTPIGKKSALSAPDVASMLTQLPKRAAFVRSGEEVGVIYTENTLPPVDELTLRDRLHLIREQTRLKYCRNLEEPEVTTSDELDDTMLRPIVGKPQPSQWEEVE
jgi:hypothetical protein